MIVYGSENEFGQTYGFENKSGGVAVRFSRNNPPDGRAGDGIKEYYFQGGTYNGFTLTDEQMQELFMAWLACRKEYGFE